MGSFEAFVARKEAEAACATLWPLVTEAREGGEPGTPLYPGPLEGELIVRKRGTGADEGVVFEHTRLT